MPLSSTVRAACVLTLVLGFPLASRPASAQPAWQGGVDFVTALPVGAFATTVGLAPGGLFWVDRQLGSSPFSLGGEFGGVVYGSENWTSAVVGAPNLSLNMSTSNDLLLWGLRLAAGRRTGRWRPYALASLGGQSLLTTTRASQPGITGDKVASTTDLSDSVLAYGGGIGLTRNLNASGRARLAIAARYSRGGPANYLTKGAIDRGGDSLHLDVSRTRTDTVLFTIGVEGGSR